MKKTLRHILTFGFVLIGIAVYGQEFNFDIHNTTLNEYLEMERNLGNEQIPNIRNHISAENAQPIKFRRKQKIISDLVGHYYFKKKDSTMSYIRYEWDESLLTLKANTNDKKSKKYQKALIRKFNEIEKMIANIYGEPVSEGDLSDLRIANDDIKGGLKKNVKWFPNDSTEIEMYANVSNYYEKRGMVTTSPTHRIRLYVRNTKKTEQITPELSEMRIDSLNGISKQYIASLEDGNLEKSKSYLSEMIIEQVTDEQLKALISGIDFDRELELVYSGIQMAMNGKAFAMLQYKYNDDQNSPPKEMIKVIFDDKNKIVGIQPMKMQN
ncbi:hypothetical protein LX95_02860 [Mesonia algae]|uniref:Uncharacterized protein n=1 Tax=Mesonia algae TaxID=213248 RepID=A0A2W7IFT8_9FLAO|nr:hypothetical protein [Mesonia algae]PZW37633.1 hypothetical protein LX95_02860 [Mesonia algae]